MVLILIYADFKKNVDADYEVVKIGSNKLRKYFILILYYIIIYVYEK